MTDKNTIFGALAVLEEAQKVADQLNKTAAAAVAAMPEKVQIGVRDGVSRGVEEGTKNALKSLENRVRAARGVLDGFEVAERRLRRLGGILSVFIASLAATSVVIAGVWTWFLRSEAADLETRIAIARQTLVDLDKKTFGIQLLEDNGARWIILEKGQTFGRKGATGEQEAVSIVSKSSK